MNELIPTMDDGTSTQSLKRSMLCRELRIDSTSDDRIPTEIWQDWIWQKRDRNATVSTVATVPVFPADQEVECSELPLVVELPNEIFADLHHFFNPTSITKTEIWQDWIWQKRDRNATVSTVAAVPIFPADQEVERSELPLVFGLPNEIFADLHHFFNPTAITKW